YHHTTIGEHEDLARASLDDVKAFFRTYYAPCNATLAVVGDIDIERTRQLVDKYFGTLPTVPLPPRRPPMRPTSPVVSSVTMEANVQLPRIEYVWPGAVPFAQGDVELELLARVLTTGGPGGGGGRRRRPGPGGGGGGGMGGGGKTGRLERRLV